MIEQQQSQEELIGAGAFNEVLQKENSSWHALEGLSFDDALAKIANDIVGFCFRLAIAILVFYLGRFVIKKLYSLCYKVMIRRNVDPSLMTFLLSLVKIVLYFILVVTIIGLLGIETSSFLALFASAGVAVGMALSGTLQNFAGGVLILLLKPYRVGDFIETQGYTGYVKAIQIFYTVINTVDNRAIIIPNGGLSTGTINNYSFECYRRVEWEVSLSYGTDFNAARDFILKMLDEDNRVVKKYIEDDKIERAKELLRNADGEMTTERMEAIARQAGLIKETRKRPWFVRIFKRKKSGTELVKERMAEQLAQSGQKPQKVDRSPFVGLNQMADSSINLVVRAWTRSDDYWDLFFQMNARLYTELPQNGFSFPFPQMDVHLVDGVKVVEAAN